jgi:hypothetical protein
MGRLGWMGRTERLGSTGPSVMSGAASRHCVMGTWPSWVANRWAHQRAGRKVDWAARPLEERRVLPGLPALLVVRPMAGPPPLCRALTFLARQAHLDHLARRGRLPLPHRPQVRSPPLVLRWLPGQTAPTAVQVRAEAEAVRASESAPVRARAAVLAAWEHAAAVMAPAAEEEEHPWRSCRGTAPSYWTPSFW